MPNVRMRGCIPALTLGFIAIALCRPADAWMLDSGRKETEKGSSRAVFAADRGDMGTASLEFQDELPDLTVTHVSVDSNAKTVRATVCNTRSSRNLRNVEVAFYCYGKRGGRRYRKEIGREVIDELPCGPQNGVEVTLATATENIYRPLEVLVDPKDAVVEEDETNNTKKFKTNKMPPPGLLRIEELEL